MIYYKNKIRFKKNQKLQCLKLFKSIGDAGEGESGTVQVLEYRKTT